MFAAIIAYATLLLTVAVAVTRPRIGNWQAGPATAAVGAIVILLSADVVQFDDVAHSVVLHWRPFLMIIATMVLAAVAERIGAIARIAESLFSNRSATPAQLFKQVFLMCALVSTALNNDAMIVLLTPLVLGLVQHRFPNRPQLLAPFAFVVFMAIGVAPFYISNPMNMIVAEYAKVNFNQYASWMVPVAVAGWIVTYPIVRFYFRRELESSGQEASGDTGPREVAFSLPQINVLIILVVAVGAYPIVAYLDGPSIWIVAVLAAGLAVWVSTSAGAVNLKDLLLRTVAWDIFVFLLGVYVIAIGLRNVGFTTLLAEVYGDADIFWIGGVSALGSALVNNHPMSLINMMAFDAMPHAGRREIFAALIGGDLGPRLLPIGSLAGLLWLNACRRAGVSVSLKTFVGLGFLVTIPAMGVSLAILLLRSWY